MAKKDVSFWLPKNRYYELKYYCLQYKYWQKVVKEARSSEESEKAKLAIFLLENSILIANPPFPHYILLDCVTNGVSFNKLKDTYKDGMPDKEVFYDSYRKFFWFLSKERGI